MQVAEKTEFIFLDVSFPSNKKNRQKALIIENFNFSSFTWYQSHAMKGPWRTECSLSEDFMSQLGINLGFAPDQCIRATGN